MSINLTPYRFSWIAHPRQGGGKLILAAAERVGPIANLLLVVHRYAWSLAQHPVAMIGRIQSRIDTHQKIIST
jgi:hypothetical protein